MTKLTTQPYNWNRQITEDKIWDDHLSYYTYEATKKQTPQDMVTEFHKTFGQPVGVKYDPYSNLDELRFKLVEEECEEVGEAVNSEHLLKELADLVYVAYGYAVTFGWDLDEAVRRVHISNMSKLDPVTGKPIYREDGKVIKSSAYKEPDLRDLV